MADENIINKYSVDQIMKITGQKSGTVNSYRDLLIKYEVISNNQDIDEVGLSVFQKAIEYKEKTVDTWVNVMEKSIQEGYNDQLKVPFYWTKKIIVDSIISDIVSQRVEVIQPFGSGAHTLKKNNDFNRELEIICSFMIDNFQELGMKDSTFAKSLGTDVNGTTTHILRGTDFIYYLVGKVNHHTTNEEIHIFYNDSKEFNIMRCKYIFGGPTKIGIIKDLWDAICEHHRNVSN